MEHEPLLPEETNTRKLYLSSNSLFYLITAAKWANFLAVIGFIFIGISALGIFSLMFGTSILAVDTDSYASADTLTGFGVAYMFFLICFSIPVFYLYQFSAKAKNAIAHHNNERLEESIDFLKKHFKFVGIIVIITLAFNLLGLFVGVALGIFDAIAAA